MKKTPSYWLTSCTLLVCLELLPGRIMTSISLFSLQLLLRPSVLIASISCILVDFCPGRPLQRHSHHPAVPGTVSAHHQLLTAAKAALQKREVGSAESTGNKYISKYTYRSSTERWACTCLVCVFSPWCLTSSTITLSWFIKLASPPALCDFWFLHEGDRRLYF